MHQRRAQRRRRANTDPDCRGPARPVSASLLASLNIVKTFTPDLSGLCRRTHADHHARFPEQFQLSLSASLSRYRHDLRRYTGYAGGSVDGLGFDDGTRALPSEVPATGGWKPGAGSI
jgi:hypothetical protein